MVRSYPVPAAGTGTAEVGTLAVVRTEAAVAHTPVVVAVAHTLAAAVRIPQVAEVAVDSRTGDVSRNLPCGGLGLSTVTTTVSTAVSCTG